MKAMILNATETYPDLMVYQTTNSQGDQVMKIKVYNIVFIQDEDSLIELAKHYQVDDWSDLDDEQVIEYLKQWHQDDLKFYDSNNYDAEKLNTEFLGYQIDDNEEEGYLFSRNDSLNYVGLSYFKKV